MKAVLKHELSGYFHSLTAYVFGAFLLVFVGIGSMLYNIQQAVANFEYVLGFISLIFVGLVPILTMESSGRRAKTREQTNFFIRCRLQRQILSLENILRF